MLPNLQKNENPATIVLTRYFIRIYKLYLVIRNKLTFGPIIMNNPSAPKKITWIIGLICGILGIIGHYADVQILKQYEYTLLLVGFIVLALGTTVKGI